jgi:hypothetical protein
MIRISDRYKGDWATSGEKWELYWYRDAGTLRSLHRAFT